MKLYVCITEKGPDFHPCHRAYAALIRAGYQPDVEKVGGVRFVPPPFRNTPGRRKITQLTGNRHVPTLVLGDGTVVDGSQNIVDWAAKRSIG